MRRRLIQLATNLALAGVAASLALAGAEVALRLVSRDPFAGRHALFNEYDPLLGWRPIPGQTRVLETPEYRVVRSFNELGFRGPLVPFAKPPGERRIVVLGDSFAEGYSVPFEALFSEKLEGLLDARGASTEVVNLGRAGYSTDQELLLFRELGRRFAPDDVVLMFHTNDIWYNSQPLYGPWGRGAKPVFVLDHGKLRLTNVPVANPAPSEPEAPPSADPLLRTKIFLMDHSYLYRWVRDRVKNTGWLYTRVRALGLGALDDGSSGPLVPYEFRVYAADPEPDVEAAWKVTDALLAELRDEVRAAGARLLVFYVPHPLEVEPAVWELFCRNYAVAEPAWDPAVVEDRLARTLARLGVRFVPARVAFRKADADHGPLYWKQDGHWNAAGHELAAQLLAQALAR